MKTRTMIILFPIIGVVSLASIFYASQLPHYSLEIHGMKDIYHTGEEYSFYYTLSGFGNTCGTWLVWYPDQNGKIITQGEVIDCYRPTTQDLSYDSRKDLRIFSSIVPDIEGIYNVTVSVEKIKEPVIHEFKVISANEDVDDFEKTWGGPGNRHPAFWGFDIPKVCTEDMIKHLVKHSSMFDRDVPYAIEDIGHDINVYDFDRCVEELLEKNPKELENEN